MLEELKKQVLEANVELWERGLALFTWGNASGIDFDEGLVVIKPSGIKYENMQISDMVVLDLLGNVIEGDLRPSSDTPTHLELYRLFPDIGGIVHTHSTYATAFAQAGKSIPVYGTTHADCFSESVPCSRELFEIEVNGDYEKNTGAVISETVKNSEILRVSACLIKSHGPFVWGKDVQQAVYNAAVLEETAKMAFLSLQLNGNISEIPEYLARKHYKRKHGKDAYYGQH